MPSILSTNATVSVEKSKIIFGPIHSRRFGMSLGVDLSPAIKQCNFDCLYCELAPMATVEKQSISVSVEAIIEALQPHLHDKIDVITLTANGEPTLYPDLERLIDAINAIKEEKQTLILSNAAALTDARVFNALLKLDQVKLSLDAVTPEIFKKIDRPHKTIDVNAIVTKVIEFSQCFKGKLFMEILFVHTLNDTAEEIAKLNDVMLKIDASRIDIGTIDRPPAYPVSGVSYKELYEIALRFDKALPIHIASRIHAEPNNAFYTPQEICNTLDKRPLTQEDINLLFDEATQESLKTLLESGMVTTKSTNGLIFYTLDNK